MEFYLWADMKTATPPGVRGCSALCSSAGRALEWYAPNPHGDIHSEGCYARIDGVYENTSQPGVTSAVLDWPCARDEDCRYAFTGYSCYVPCSYYLPCCVPCCLPCYVPCCL